MMDILKGFLKEFVSHQVQSLERQDEARQTSRTCVNFSPIIPIRSFPDDSWFGGNPRLPPEMPWPKKNDRQMCFACQINVAKLPKELWSGAGPREGWLVVFLDRETAEPTIIHFTGACEERRGPPQISAGWARTYSEEFRKAGIFRLPHWPMQVNVGNIRARKAAWESQDNIWDDVEPNLSEPEIQPFNTASLNHLMVALDEYFVNQFKALCRLSVLYRLRKEDSDWIVEAKLNAVKSLETFQQVDAALLGGRLGGFNKDAKFDGERVSSTLAMIARLPTYDLQILEKDDEGYCRLKYQHTVLSDRPRPKAYPSHWWTTYSGHLYWLTLNAYTTNPDLLSAPLRARMERIWNEDASAFHGAMGHAPEGDVDDEYEGNSNTVVLLELPTSRMQGWIWADCYSIVFLIDRHALARGDFSRVRYNITN